MIPTERRPARRRRLAKADGRERIAGVAALARVAALAGVATLALLSRPGAAAAQDAGAAGESAASGPVVRAILFFSPTCPHCEHVMRVDLPPLVARHGDRLRIVALNSAIPAGHEAYEEAVRVLGIPPARRGVPLLVVGGEHLVGSREIPERLPAIVDEGLAAGGVDWPDLPRVRELLAAQGLLADPERVAAPPAPESAPPAPESAPPAPAPSPPAPAPETVPEPSSTPPGTRPAERPPAAERATGGEDGAIATRAGSPADSASAPGSDASVPGPETPTAAATPTAPATPSAATPLTPDGPPPSAPAGPADRFRMDPVGNSASVIALLAMLAALGWSLAAAAGRARPPGLSPRVVPALAVAGLLVAGYLAWVEATGSDAVCGPVGDCNTVQQSAYARLFGVPVGLLGVLGYLAMLAAWARARRAASADPGASAGSWRVLWGLALAATLFSAWLTFLEPFVIGATCAWCLTSALLVTAILLAATGPAWPGRAPVAVGARPEGTPGAGAPG